MILAIDCGNTRLKWGLSCLEDSAGRAGAGHWLAGGSLPLARLAALEEEWRAIPPPDRIVVANVAGDEARAMLERTLGRMAAAPQWVTSRASQCGVHNSYADPAQLGPDRWASLIGARGLHEGACLVVMAGTATTVDLLSSAGVFGGGIILPGVALMKWSLAQRTAGLAESEGRYCREPRSTADAIETGCLLAQAGAIERMHAELEAGAICLLSGGAAAPLAERLRVPVRVVDNLALEGLARIALDAESS